MPEHSVEKGETYRASLGAILTLTTGTMLARLDEWYGLQDYLSGYSLMTHERIAPEHDHTQTLLRQFPGLAEAVAPRNMKSEETCRLWVESVARYVGWDSAEVRRG